MKTERALLAYERLRDQPLWRLLASPKAPAFIALLQAELYEDQKSLPASVFYDRIERDLEELRAVGQELPQTAKDYVSNWLADGYVERRFPAGSAEEQFEISAQAVEAIRFISTIEQPHSTATESRLALVISALVQLAEETDSDQKRRIERLLAERARIDLQLEHAQGGNIRVLADSSALERTREIISLAENLLGDFRRVRDQFDRLNRDLREQLVESDGRRGDVLDALFAGIDLISESDAGRTFSAFWRLLTDPERSGALEDALDTVLSREFLNEIDLRRRSFLRRLPSTLLEQGGFVHEVLQTLAKSLKQFVQSREFLEQKRLNQLLRDAQKAALGLKDEVKATESLDYFLELTSSRLRSYAQWQLFDPSLELTSEGMESGDRPDVDLAAIAELVADSEIDFRRLKENIRAILSLRSQASIRDILDSYPASQGLGSVVGLLALGSRHGIKGEGHELVHWMGRDEHQRRARIPTIYFVKERARELV
ncbi:MAG TPA: DUF3375 domain-containing protein [Edaphobacter sp.]|uniref:DUF3375 domain-containing protein n=1 Tax=Edaphobacter sp. TaxID=1934404 RepID=UPI002C85F5EA|nr:DUF3375 domain-containing protein [Edaphobacter sp.]HUZ94368.1 DUF3375 domain-containing protein [Edaphobacter sp.]